MKLSIGFEIFLVLVLFLGGWWFFYKYSGGPISWDELWYMHLSLNPEAFPEIINRYFHIYFQKTFFWIAGDPFSGAKLFWSFLISTTAVLVYINARIISGHNNFLHGLISLSIFFSLGLIFVWPGVTYPDFTVMMMVTAGLTIYLIHLRFNRYHRLVLGLLGIIFFFAFKSKETGIILGIIVLGLGFSESDTFNFRHLIKKTTFVLEGVVLGMLFLMCLDRIFLGDALFSLRLSHIKTLIHFNFGEYVRQGNNYFSAILTAMPVAFILYVISIIKKRDCNFKAAEKIAWLLPLGLLLFLTLTIIRGKWGVFPRYYLPVVPIIAILGAQFFETEPQIKIHDLIKNILVILGALTLVLLAFVFFNLFINKSEWTLDQFVKAIVFPFAFSALFLLIILVKKWRLISITAVFTCLLLITGYPTYKNVTNFANRIFAVKSEKRFSPFAAFSVDIACSEDVRVFISQNIFKKYRTLSRDVWSSQWMFNLYFACHLELSQFIYSDSTNDLVNNDCTYAYITVDDWEGLSYETKKNLDAQYKIDKADKEGVIFLRKKEGIKFHRHSGTP